MFGIKTRKEVAMLKNQVGGIEERLEEARFREKISAEVKQVAALLLPATVAPVWCGQPLCPADVRKLGYGLQELIDAGYIALPKPNRKKKS